MSDTQFAEGMNAYKPSENAPDFIKANLVFNVTDFTRWLESHATPEGKVRVVVKESKGGKYYAQLDQFTKDAPRVETATDDDVASSIPF